MERHRDYWYSLLIIVLVIINIFSLSSAFSQVKDTSSESPFHRSIQAVKVTNPPVIDGRLNDAVWQTIQFQSDFIQREPNEGEPATERTEIAVIYDDKYLYIGARCYDSEPENIIATEMRRDEMLYSDDYFHITLDTYHDHRNAIYFATNPLGMRRDGTSSDEGKINNQNWDGVWLCKTSIDDKGWYVEIAIPWQTLRFKEGDNLTWGANFIRSLQRKNEDDYWRLVPRYAGHSGQDRMSEAGHITGFQGLKTGGKYELKPFVTGGVQNDDQTNNTTETLRDFGVDMKWNLTSTLTADFTYNTDFAQVEADQEQVNLTRFSLFFPEKREFFLEGAETFTFGQTGGRMPWRPEAGNIQLFHSRTIGIEERQRIPLIGGAKLNGKVGKYTIGLLSLNSEETTISVDPEETSLLEDSSAVVPETNFSVFRVKRDMFSRSSVGVMFLNKQGKKGSYNRSLGFDSNFPVNQNLTFFINAAGTYAPETEGEADPQKNNFAGNAGFNWQSDLWQYRASFLEIQNDFNPEMGFIRRTDIRRTEGNITFAPRPERWSSIRQFRFGITGQYQTDHSNYLLNRKIEGQLNINFENTARLNFDITQEYEYLDFDWDIREGFMIPFAGYDNTEYRMRYNSNRSHAVSGEIGVSTGNYFTGTRSGGQLELDVKAFSRLIINLDYQYDLLNFPEGQFHTNRLSTRIAYSFSPDCFVKAFLQWYDDKLLNDGQNLVSGNIILRYHYKPGSDFYLVFNQENLFGPGQDILQNRTVLTKINYFLRR